MERFRFLNRHRTSSKGFWIERPSETVQTATCFRMKSVRLAQSRSSWTKDSRWKGFDRNATWIRHREGSFLERKRTCYATSRPDKAPLLTLPTMLTISRVLAVPALAAAFYLPCKSSSAISAGIFVLASLTDWLDGYLARKLKVVSDFGAFLDPVADKLMVATALVVLCSWPPSGCTSFAIPIPAAAIIGREITMSALREWAAASGGEAHNAVAVNSLGKWKTATQMIALTVLLLFRDYSATSAIVMCGLCMLYISALLALWSLGSYFAGFVKFIRS